MWIRLASLVLEPGAGFYLLDSMRLTLKEPSFQDLGMLPGMTDYSMYPFSSSSDAQCVEQVSGSSENPLVHGAAACGKG